MIDLGRKRNFGHMVEMSADDKEKISYPTLCIYGVKNLPFSIDDVGKKVKVVVEAVVSRVAKSKDSEDELEMDADLEIKSLGDVNYSEEEKPDADMEDMKKRVEDKKSKKSIFEGE